MLRFFFGVRYLNVIAVVSMLIGMAVMLVLGAYHVYEALHAMIEPAHAEVNESMVFIVESLDNFILAFILMYFAYSVFFLFIAPEDDAESAGKMSLPKWLRVQSVHEMKKTLLQVVVVALSLHWLRIVIIHTNEFQYTDLVLPASILAIAGAVRIMKLDHS